MKIDSGHWMITTDIPGQLVAFLVEGMYEPDQKVKVKVRKVVVSSDLKVEAKEAKGVHTPHLTPMMLNGRVTGKINNMMIKLTGLIKNGGPMRHGIKDGILPSIRVLRML